MQKLYYCSGKIPVYYNNEEQDKNECIPWYESDGANLMYCQQCFLDNRSKLIENKISMKPITNNKTCYCMSDKDFSDFCFISENIRVSIVNPDNYYRYKKMSEYTNSMIVGLPNDSKYMIVVENCNPNSFISIGTIIHGNEVNNYYVSMDPRCLIIKSMCHGDDLIFDEKLNDKNSITLTICVWRQHPDDNMRKYHLMVKDPITIRLQLIQRKTEINVNKINVIEDFV